MNSAGDITDQAGSQTDSMAIQSYNAQFTAYEGTGKSASQVRSLVSAINASNARSSQTAIKINGADASTYDTSALSESEKYDVTISYGTDGYVNNVGIN